jgi:hypothetical protein
MGSSQSIGNDFIGIYYDFNRIASGNYRAIGMETYEDIIIKFVRSGWDHEVLSKYYKSPFKRYATCFMVPYIPSELGPESFGEEGGMGWCWAVLYKGKLVHKDGIKFRFHGGADDVLMVRVDGELVLAANYPGNPIQQYCGWAGSKASPRTVLGGGQVGDWIELEPGIPKDMEVIIGEKPGGGFFAMLLVEEEGKEYEINNRGGRILPMFTTTEPSHKTMDNILEYMMRDGTEPNVTNVTTIFRDY